MATEGTLADPLGVPSCAICGSEECRQFHEPLWPSDYPWLPGGYDRHGEATVVQRPQTGKRKGAGMRWRS